MYKKRFNWLVVIIILAVFTGVGFIYMQGESSTPVAERSESELIVGTWQSDDDSNSVVEYSEDGTARDIYDGDTIASNTWAIVDGEQPTLEVVVGTDVFKYIILDLNEGELVMSYVPRGNILRYHKIMQE